MRPNKLSLNFSWHSLHYYERSGTVSLRTGTEKKKNAFPVQLTTSRIGNHNTYPVDDPYSAVSNDHMHTYLGFTWKGKIASQ